MRIMPWHSTHIHRPAYLPPRNQMPGGKRSLTSRHRILVKWNRWSLMKWHKAQCSRKGTKLRVRPATNLLCDLGPITYCPLLGLNFTIIKRVSWSRSVLFYKLCSWQLCRFKADASEPVFDKGEARLVDSGPTTATSNRAALFEMLSYMFK